MSDAVTQIKEIGLAEDALSLRRWPSDAPPIHSETEWRTLPGSMRTGVRADDPSVFVTRWIDMSGDNELVAWGPYKYYTVALALRKTWVTMFMNGTRIHDGLIEKGTAQVSASTGLTRCVLRAPADFLHIYVSRAYVTEYQRQLAQERGADVSAQHSYFVTDSIVKQLTVGLMHAIDGQTYYDRLYVDGVALAIVARLLNAWPSSAEPLPAFSSKATPLEKHRTEETIRYMDENIDQPISLNELATAAGLSPMHFAARFRAATGLSPHAFLLHRRIERAQELLLTTNMPVVDVALSVGFRTQAHFTTVFRRLSNETPHRWRDVHARTPIVDRE
ncbi:AraC family transcriptional regulator [Caballeronia sp. LjRoot34]|uniref:helix-turn-helix domain-containing protein n=1 Tax=Caballeronia sp. LjRoot34 TaxID=3342325 RepID=UPI003ED116EA